MGERARRLVAAAELVLVLVLGGGGVAAAEAVSGEQFRTLAERAVTDPAALNRLRGVDRVDGRPVDLRVVLEGADGEDLRARLRMLAGPVRTGSAGTGASPRDEARAILDGKRFKSPPALRPFRGVLRWLGDRLEPISGPLGRLWDRLADNRVGQVVIVAVVIGVAVLVSAALIRRRTVAGVLRDRRSRERRRPEDPDDLDRLADAAERAGDLERALRLRFRAGVLRLDRAGAIAWRPALTTGELTRTVPSTQLRELASAFEEVAYGGRPAAAEDLQSARSGWPRVLEEVGSGR